MPKRIRLTKAERIAIFRPHVMLGRLDYQESAFVQDAMYWVRRQTESLAIQLQIGKTPKQLVLEPGAIRGISDALSRSMIDTYALGVESLQNELGQAELIHQMKLQGTYTSPVVPFAAMREDELNPINGPFFPEAGVDWYSNYTLRLSGVHSVDALENTKAYLIQGVENGMNQQDTINLLRQQFPTFSEHRLENIARTETAKIYEQARYQQMNADEEVVGYEFAAIMDSRTSAICESHNGKRVPKGQEEGWIPPLHFQCRSQILPVFAWEDVQFDLPIVTPPLPGFGSTDMVIPETARNAIHIGGIPELRQVVKVVEVPKEEPLPPEPTSVKGIVKRYELGNALTPAEKKATLKTIGDAYVDNGAPKVFKGFNKEGDEIMGYAFNPEYMHKSDITGANIRYYVTLPNGLRAHPSELFPEITESKAARMAADAWEKELLSIAEHYYYDLKSITKKQFDNIYHNRYNYRKGGASQKLIDETLKEIGWTP